MRALLIALGLAALAATAHADEPVAEFQLAERDTPHVGVPFVLAMIVEGLDEQPAPTAAKLEIANAAVTFVGAEPNIQRGYQNINGKVSNFVKVTWVLRWSIEPHKEGRLHIPSLTVSQGGKHATAQGGDSNVDTIPVSDAMKLSLALPTRPIFVGETVPVTLTWLFRASPSDMRWSIPLMVLDAFTVSAPPSTGKAKDKLLSIETGSKDLKLPYEDDEIEDGGARFGRVTATLLLTPRTAGKLDVPASSVVAGLATGPADFFGRRATKLYRAMDVARTLEVKPLPQTDRPASFAGAVGEQFSIDVTASRSVVQLGEPVELAIRIKSSQRLDTLALPRLDGEGGLPKDKFQVPGDPPTGELADDGKTKTFKVTAQVTGPASAVPAIAFAYFDPVKGAYQTIHSEPIALSVAGGSVVGAGDVVAARPKAAAPSNALEPDTALVDAELALSSPGQDDDRPLGGAALWLLIGLLYAVPVALLVARRWQLGTQGQREEAAEVRAARKKVEDLLDRAGTDPAREVAGPLAAALRELARLLGREVAGSDVLARLETESFAPGAASVPLSTDLRSDAAGLLRRWTTEARKKRVPTAVALVVLAGFAGHAEAANPAGALADGRAAYQEAMQLTGNATARRAAFARATSAFGEAVRATPDRPELLADWGNAALGAGDVATATLAYRRALAIDGANPRARHNLAWLRSRQAVGMRPSAASATDTLLFFHAWPRGKKLVIGSAAFALAILLLVPWSGRRRRGLGALALLPFAVWLAMIVSVAFEDRHPDDAVVMDDVVLRAADSAGAPAALPQPLPRGVEVTVLERRDAWTKVRLAGGMAGWVPTGAVERIAR